MRLIHVFYVVGSLAVLIIAGLLSCDSSSPFIPVEPDPEAPNFSLFATPNTTDTPQLPGVTTLQWTCTDPNGDPLTYTVYLGTTKYPQVAKSGLTVPHYTPRSLKMGAHYYWWVAAEDDDGNITHSPRWEFITASDVIYPLAVGNHWEYIGRQYWLDPATGYVVDSLPGINLHSVVDLISYDTLSDHIPTYHFYEVTEDMSSAFHNIAEYYFNNTADGFYEYAYNGTSLIAPLKAGTSHPIEFNGQRFHNISALLRNVSITPGNSFNVTAVSNGSLIYEYPPVKSLVYPLEVGSHWVARPNGYIWRIEKEVTDFLPVHTQYGTYNSYIINWQYYTDFANREFGARKPGPGGNGDTGSDEPIISSLDTSISIVDYVSLYGLVKRDISLQGIVITDPMGSQDDTLDVVIKWEMTNFELKQED